MFISKGAVFVGPICIPIIHRISLAMMEGKKGPSSKAARGTEIHEFEIATCSAILNHFLLFCVFGLFEAII